MSDSAGLRGAEAALLLAASRLTLTDEEAARLRAAAAQVQDWDVLIAFARAHRVLPFVARHLADAATDVVPPPAMRELQRARLEIAAHALDGACELARIQRAFASAGIRSLPYKGPQLSVLAYGDVSAREFVDLDFVVRPAEVARARDVLVSLGFRPREGMTRAQEGAIYGGQGHFPYVRAGASPLTVELHWRFAASRFPWNPPLGEILGRSAMVTIGGASVPAPERTDHVLLLLLHGTRHRWEQLEWVVAVAELLRGGAVEGEVLLARALPLDGVRAVLIGLEVSRRLLGAPVPPVAAALIERDAEVQALTATVLGQMFPDVDRGDGFPEGQFYLRCLERSRNRARFVVQSVLRPTPREWELVRLAGWMTAIYVPLRLGRLLLRRSSLFKR